MAIYRLGSYVAKHLEMPVPEWVKERLKEKVSEGDVQEVLEVIGAIIDEYTKMLKDYVSLVMVNARAIGVQVCAYSTPCNKKTKMCGTCLGKYKAHYPNFKIRVEGLPDNDKKGGWREVRKYQLTDFLRRFFSEDQIKEFYLLSQFRIDYLIFYNYLALRTNHDGLLGAGLLE